MPVVFISHASGDKYFVDLLTEILNYHHISTWYDSEDIHVGSDYSERINRGLLDSDFLIVVISTKSCESKWVTREISTFLANKRKSNIIPIMLEKVDPDIVFDGLRDIQGIKFYENMLAGFQKLMKVFDKEFLPTIELRAGVDRRGGERRGPDRRKASTNQRMRIGLWKAFEGKTGIGKFEKVFDLTTERRLDIIDSVTGELSKYEVFSKDGSKHTLNFEEIDKLFYGIREEMDKREYVTAVIIIDAIAEEILRNYQLEPIDRRGKQEDRRKDDRRQG